MSNWRRGGSGDTAGTTSWIELDDSEEQWGNDAPEIPEIDEKIGENEQERILREWLEELEGRPSTEFDHLRSLAGQHPIEHLHRSLSHTLGLYPYSTVFPAYFPDCKTDAPATISRNEPGTLILSDSGRRASRIPLSADPIRKPYPSTTPSPAPVEDSTARISNRSLNYNPTQPTAEAPGLRASPQNGKRPVISPRKSQMIEQFPSSTQNTQCSPQSTLSSGETTFRQGSICTSFTQHSNGSKNNHRSDSGNGGTEASNGKKVIGENIQQTAQGSAKPITTSKTLLPTSLLPFAVPHGFGTTRRLGIEPSLNYPCGNPNHITRKGIPKHQSMIEYRNLMLEANVECRKRGVFFDSSGRLFRMSPTGQGNPIAVAQHRQSQYVSPYSSPRTQAIDSGLGSSTPATAAPQTLAVHSRHNDVEMSQSSLTTVPWQVGWDNMQTSRSSLKRPRSEESEVRRGDEAEQGQWKRPKSSESRS